MKMPGGSSLLLLSLLILIILIIPVSRCCILCYLRLPPRPRSIDHLWLSALEDVSFPDTVAEMCNISQHRLPFSANCRQGLAKIFCSLSDFLDNKWRECSLDDFEQCANCSLNKLEIVQQTSWVITWLDSLGKMPPAVSEGNYYWLGDYEQCSVLRKTEAFNGRYCRVLLNIPDLEMYQHCPQPDVLDIHLGLCAPATCTPEEITQLAQMVTPYAVGAECETTLDWPLPSQVFLLAVVVWLCLLTIGTFIDVHGAKFRPNKQLAVFARCVSIPRNGNLALSTKRSHEYHSVQGLQVFTVSLVIMGNCFIDVLPYIENVLFSYDSVYSWQLHPLNNFTYHIDALIAINALFTSLMVRHTLQTTDDIKKLYFERLLQVLPAFAFLILFMTFLFERLSSGPVWMHNDLIARCKDSWWKNILFINNLFPAEQTCLDGGYLYSLEAQFFLLLLPMLYLSRHYYTAVLAAAVSTFFASIIYIFYEMSSSKLPPTLMLTADPISAETYEVYIDSLYTKPWARAPAFLIGFLFSFFFADRLRMSKALLYLSRFVLLILGASVVSALYPYAIGNSNSQIYLAAYSALHRPFWAFIVCSIVYLGYRNRSTDSSFSQLLEWRIFSPLAKNTFMVFLVSEPVSLYLFSSLHRPLHATLWSLLNIAVGTIILSNIFALLLDIFISMPLRNIVYELIKDKDCDSIVLNVISDASNDVNGDKERLK